MLLCAPFSTFITFDLLFFEVFWSVMRICWVIVLNRNDSCVRRCITPWSWLEVYTYFNFYWIIDFLIYIHKHCKFFVFSVIIYFFISVNILVYLFESFEQGNRGKGKQIILHAYLIKYALLLLLKQTYSLLKSTDFYFIYKVKTDMQSI